METHRLSGIKRTATIVLHTTDEPTPTPAHLQDMSTQRERRTGWDEFQEISRHYQVDAARNVFAAIYCGGDL